MLLERARQRLQGRADCLLDDLSLSVGRDCGMDSTDKVRAIDQQKPDTAKLHIRSLPAAVQLVQHSSTRTPNGRVPVLHIVPQ